MGLLVAKAETERLHLILMCCLYVVETFDEHETEALFSLS